MSVRAAVYLNLCFVTKGSVIGCWMGEGGGGVQRVFGLSIYQYGGWREGGGGTGREELENMTRLSIYQLF